MFGSICDWMRTRAVEDAYRYGTGVTGYSHSLPVQVGIGLGLNWASIKAAVQRWDWRMIHHFRLKSA